MSLEASLFTFLTDAASVAAFVGTRVFPGVIPQGAAQPAIVYAKRGRNRQQLFCGTDGLKRTRVDIDCYATSYRQSVLLANAVTAVLEDFSGTMGTTRVPRIFLESETDLSDLEPGLYRQSQSWAIWHREL
jgi:hypothetical protein